MRTQLTLAFISLFLVSGCTHLNEAMNNQHQSLASGGPAGATFNGGFPFSHRPWKVGQWAKLAVRNDNVWNLQTVSLVGQDGDSFWLEVETIDPTTETNPNRIKMQVKGYDPGNPESVKTMQVGQVITQNGENQPMQAPPFIGPMTGGWVLQNFQVDASKAQGETVTVPAGTFSNAVRIRFNAKWGPFESESDNWLHTDVPIWGIVRSVSTDGKYETRLLEFGHEGAESKIDDSQVMRGPLG